MGDVTCPSQAEAALGMKKPRNMRATAAAIALQRAHGTVEKDVLA
ncbi:hypothetical protein [Mycetohabitans endofungorum]|nr:hypothetical protein [Mycetohabitans endofungorum]